MNSFQKIKKEIIPLNNKERKILLLIIIIIFQFLLFYAPALADQAIKKSENKTITTTTVQKTTKTVKKLTHPKLMTIEIIPETVLNTSSHVITAYNSEKNQTDDSPCITANGFNVCKHGKEDTIAANFLKFGTRVRIPELFGDHVFIVRDRMNKKHPNRVDIWMKNKSDALDFGIKFTKIEILK